jgi:hypothetical protein
MRAGGGKMALVGELAADRQSHDAAGTRYARATVVSYVSLLSKLGK